jgi:hypothetical protein
MCRIAVFWILLVGFSVSGISAAVAATPSTPLPSMHSTDVQPVSNGDNFLSAPDDHRCCHVDRASDLGCGSASAALMTPFSWSFDDAPRQIALSPSVGRTAPPHRLDPPPPKVS